MSSSSYVLHYITDYLSDDDILLFMTSTNSIYKSPFIQKRRNEIYQCVFWKYENHLRQMLSLFPKDAMKTLAEITSQQFHLSVFIQDIKQWIFNWQPLWWNAYTRDVSKTISRFSSSPALWQKNLYIRRRIQRHLSLLRLFWFQQKSWSEYVHMIQWLVPKTEKYRSLHDWVQMSEKESC